MTLGKLGPFVEIGSDGIVYRHRITPALMLLGRENEAVVLGQVSDNLTDGVPVEVEWTATDSGRVVRCLLILGKDKVDFVRWPEEVSDGP